MILNCYTVSSLEKVFPHEPPKSKETHGSMLKNEHYHFQLALQACAHDSPFLNDVIVESPIKEHIRLYNVELLPCGAFTGETDDDYLFTDARLVPELLLPFDERKLTLPDKQWKSVYVSVFCKDGIPAGEYPVSFTVKTHAGDVVGRCEYTVEVIDATLPENPLILTNWMHYDGICAQHGVEPFTPEFYAVFDKYLQAYVEMGMNTLFTPLFTPPLDTKVGAERRTTQLIDVTKTPSGWEFCFEKLDEFIRFALKHGVERFEMNHLFTQWGGKACPKIMAQTPQGCKRVFGWDTPSTGEEYAAFLKAFLPQLMQRLEKLEIKQNCLFHLTDEPLAAHEQTYAYCKQLVKPLIEHLPIMDAISELEYAQKGHVDLPVAVLDVYKQFEESYPKDFMVYYCCLPAGRHYTNRFMNMPLQRTRILGFMLYKSKAKGFLHWGFNFYNSAKSVFSINPYLQTDGAGPFPSGDSFVVYPKAGGVDFSIRAFAMREAMDDYLAMKALEEKIGAAAAKTLVEKFGVDGFNVYPHSIEQHKAFRLAINEEIKKRL